MPYDQWNTVWSVKYCMISKYNMIGKIQFDQWNAIWLVKYSMISEILMISEIQYMVKNFIQRLNKILGVWKIHYSLFLTQFVQIEHVGILLFMIALSSLGWEKKEIILGKRFAVMITILLLVISKIKSIIRSSDFLLFTLVVFLSKTFCHIVTFWYLVQVNPGLTMSLFDSASFCMIFVWVQWFHPKS